ncbi:hypothetical protein MN210_03570 [Psychrobacter raelei]|uniref:Spore coat protein U domain-containing protein n=1 Tax=Psychrobacter raelei TaxID=2565531 RepID=A0AAT9PFJ4_9GAMM
MKYMTLNGLLKRLRQHKRLINMTGAVLLGLGSHAALACPVVYFNNQVTRLNTVNDIDGQTIYFCMQTGFSNNQLQYTFQPNDLLTGGSQAIVMGQAIQRAPISNRSINLIGPGTNTLNLKSLLAKTNFPVNGGALGKASVFNFYSRVNSRRGEDQCTPRDQYTVIRRYIRATPRLFQANNKYPSPGGPKIATALADGNNLAIIKDAEIRQGNSFLKADITFYHANAGQSGQYFTDRDTGNQFCWVAVSTTIDIKDNARNINHAGDYFVDVGVYNP